MTENEFLAQVRELCRWHGLLTYHTHRSDRSDPGFPDLVIVGENGILWRELKTDVGRLTTMQKFWLETLRRVGQDADVWRPSDLDRIKSELGQMARLSVRQPQIAPKKRRQVRARITLM